MYINDISITNLSYGLCGDCNKKDVCKYKEEVMSAERNFSGNVNLPECLIATLKCKYKDFSYATLRGTYDSDCAHSSNTVTRVKDVCSTPTDTSTIHTY